MNFKDYLVKAEEEEANLIEATCSEKCKNKEGDAKKRCMEQCKKAAQQEHYSNMRMHDRQ